MIELRKFSRDDAADLARLMKTEEQEAEKLIKQWNTGSFNGKRFEAYAVRHDGGTVGFITLFQHSGAVVSIGPEIFEEYRGRGFGTEAMMCALDIARSEGFKTVSQQIRTNNGASLKMHEKLGFETDGSVFRNIKGNDCLIYLKSLE